MAFTEVTVGTYHFLEEYLSDKRFTVTNTTTRTLLNNEMAIFGGVFGNVLDPAGIVASAAGTLNINDERIIKTNQIASVTFAVGETVYIIAGDNTNPASLTNVAGSNKAIGVVTEIDPAATQLYVVFKPNKQFVDKDTETKAIAALQASDALNPFKVAVLTVDADASSGLAFANAATGLAVGDIIVNVFAHSDGTVSGATAKISHGDGGADITNAINVATANAVVAAASVAGGVVTADGLTVTTNGATDVATLYVMYIPA